MRGWLSLVVGVVFLTCAVRMSSQSKPVLVVEPFTAAAGVELPYDLKQMQGQLVASLKVEIGKDFSIVAESPATSGGTLYRLGGEVTGWRPGNAAKRLVIGMGSGREATDLHYWISDASDKKVIERTDTIRTNYYSQAAGSVGTLVYPIAQKIGGRIKDAKLK